MALQGSGQISLGDVANEFGYTDGSQTKLGSYRTTNGQGNYPLSVGSLSYSSIDGGGAVPVGSAQIKLSDFRSTQLQTVVNFYGSGKGGTRLNAYNRYSSNSSGDVTVVGNYRSRPTNTSGTRVKIHVNQTIGSEKNSTNHCALRTGNAWNAGTTLSVDVGSSGRIQGSGGDGGDGSVNNGSGQPGGSGSSGLGVEYTETAVNIVSGGIIAAGFGGGGGGAGGEQTDKPGTRYAAGGGGGGGAGIPVGVGGEKGQRTSGVSAGSSHSGAGTNASTSGGGGAGTAGDGGGGGNNANEAGGSAGGEGGQNGEAADAGGNNDGTGGAAGGDGSAIRRTSGSIVVDINDGSRVLPNAVAEGVA